MTKLKCPKCNSEEIKQDIIISCNATLNEDGLIEAGCDQSDPDHYGEPYCGECGEEIDIDKLKKE